MNKQFIHALAGNKAEAVVQRKPGKKKPKAGRGGAAGKGGKKPRR